MRLDQCIPIEGTAAEMLHKVEKRHQGLLKEMEKRVVTQDAHRQDPPLLDAYGIGVENVTLLGACERVEEMWKRETDSVCVEVGLRIRQHEDMSTRLPDIITAPIWLAEICHVEGQLEILVVGLREPTQNRRDRLRHSVPIVQVGKASKGSFPSLGLVKQKSPSRTDDYDIIDQPL